MTTSMSWLDLWLAGTAIYLIKCIVSKKNTHPFPPGPKPLPLLGNLLDMPFEKQWLAFSDWAEKFGTMIYLKIFGQHIIVLDSANAAVEVLEKNSSIYSDRPVFPMGGELVGWKEGLVLMPYGDKFREHRRNFHRVLGNRAAVSVYHPIEEAETHKFLQRVLAKPADLNAYLRMHIKWAIILRISHGYCIQEGGDPLVDLAGKVLDDFAQYTAVGTFMVDRIPALAYLPEWFPGAGFKRKARESRVELHDMFNQSFEFVKEQMAAGVARKSVASDLLERKTSTEEEHGIKWSAGVMFAGGTDTTVAANLAFFLAMTLYPEAQKKAQAEIDAVIGSDRLPTLADRESLPYVDALAKEVLRWHVVVPVVLRCSTVDDIHNGYYIPKGTLVASNVYRMLHDPLTYPDPMEFNPDRFLPGEGKSLQTDPRNMCFGFGRRLMNEFEIPTGMHLADTSVWIMVAMSLAIFDISKVVENGLEVIPEINPMSGAISHPKPFKCSIRARSAKATELIQQDPHY
ncbi:cytochrome P450 [Pisolithus orientalis]|uniref:cytochrome P450 n=1 Tax=Pisolithus orientalis TaxID=936130 RepID=UPI002224CA16|nr:cytochrome P450 [Pisolithus orientalis]KAI6006269.1 cytochrome P450 [Pisolithus orientalis]